MAASWDQYSMATPKRLRLETSRSVYSSIESGSSLVSPPASPRTEYRHTSSSFAQRPSSAVYSPLTRVSKPSQKRRNHNSPPNSPRSATPVSRNISPLSSRPSSPSQFGAPFSPPDTISGYTAQSASSIRLQRQRALRAQCSSTHLQDISALVARMVEKNDQCIVSSLPITSPSAETFATAQAAYPSPLSEHDDYEEQEQDDVMMDAEADEGFVEGRSSSEDDDLARATMRLRLHYRRSVEWGAADPAGSRSPPADERRVSCVTKREARVRKHSATTPRRT